MGLKLHLMKPRLGAEEEVAKTPRGGGYMPDVFLSDSSGRPCIVINATIEGLPDHREVQLVITAGTVLHVFEELAGCEDLQRYFSPEFLPNILEERRRRHGWTK